MLHCAIGRSPSFVAWLPMRHTGNFSVYLWDAAGTSTLIGSYPDTSAPVMTVYQVSTRAVVRRYSTSLIQSPRPRTAWTAAPGHGDSAERLCEHPIHRGALPALYPPVSPLRRSRLPCQRTRPLSTCIAPAQIPITVPANTSSGAYVLQSIYNAPGVASFYQCSDVTVL